MPRRTTWLYVPGDQERKLAKAADLDADVVCLDLEDAVAPDRKDAARGLVAQVLERQDFRAEVWVRVNALNTPWAEADLAMVGQVLPRVRGVLLPKVEAPWMVHRAAWHLALAEETHGLQPGSVPLAVLLETPLGVLRAEVVAQASPRVQVLLFGAEDFAAALGAERTPQGQEVAMARQWVLLTGKALGRQVIDMVYVAYRDLEGLRKEAEAAARLGFDGKQIIHPAQVPVVREAFTPAPERLAWAEKVWQAYQEARRSGQGVFVVEGKMIDPPLVLQARRLLERGGRL